MQCGNGHENIDGSGVCAECGMPLPGQPDAHPAAWLSDPTERHEHRYWNGSSWTEHVSDGGAASLDPLASATEPSSDGERALVAAGGRGESAATVAETTGHADSDKRARRSWPWVVGAIVALLVIGGIANAVNKDDTSSNQVSVVSPHRLDATSSTSRSTTTTTTLPIAQCQRIVLEVQAGLRTIATSDYQRSCGALPAGVTLDPTTTTTTTTTLPPTTTSTSPPSTLNCNPNYTPCVPDASDVDCAGGSGNGPAYVTGPVQVIGVDVYDLDSDGDGVGCE